jgi:hypothetical protein
LSLALFTLTGILGPSILFSFRSETARGAAFCGKDWKRADGNPLKFPSTKSAAFSVQTLTNLMNIVAASARVFES